MVIDMENEHCDNTDDDGCISCVTPEKIIKLEAGEPQVISGDEYDEPEPSAVRPKGWKTAKKKKNKAARQSRRNNRR